MLSKKARGGAHFISVLSVKVYGTSKMTQLVKVLVTKPHDMSFSSETHVVERMDSQLSFDFHI